MNNNVNYKTAGRLREERWWFTASIITKISKKDYSLIEDWRCWKLYNILFDFEKTNNQVEVETIIDFASHPKLEFKSIFKSTDSLQDVLNKLFDDYELFDFLANWEKLKKFYTD